VKSDPPGGRATPVLVYDALPPGKREVRMNVADNFFARTDAWLAALLLAAAMLAAWRLGIWQGRQLRRLAAEPPSSKFEDAALALLGLLLAFTFSMALGKHDRRREAVVADSNAIGDFYTCATLLPEPARSQLQGVIREYATFRLEVSRRPPPLDQQSLARFDILQGRMTDLVSRAVNAGTPVTVPLVNTLNEVSSNQALRISAVRDRLPWSIVVLLLLAAMVSTALIGRQQGATGRKGFVDALSFVLMVTLVIYVTLDLNQPSRGLITVSQEPLERLIATMKP
jgi:hypothetical protein